MRMRRRLSSVLALLASLAASAPAWAAAPDAIEWRAAFAARPAVSFTEHAIVVLAAPSVADRVAAAAQEPSARDERRWARQAAAARRIVLERLTIRGVAVRPTFVYTRVLNGFSAELTARARAELERLPGVAGVYPVRAVYPASYAAEALERAALAVPGGLQPDVTLPGYDGSGVTVALLDSGVDFAHPYLAGRVAPGYDVVDGDRRPEAERSPRDRALLETHGTQTAGIVVGRGGPGGLGGVAPGARVLPIRILGWQRVDDGSYAVVGRGDQLLAGLELAVDPDRDGGTDDAAEIALAAVVEPYAGFADSPEARAAAGALRLGTLVVAPAGNDGAAGIGFGTVAAPASAAATLAVGALDGRRSVLSARAFVSAGGATLLDAPVRVLSPFAAGHPLTLDVTASIGRTGRLTAVASGSEPSDFVDARGLSRVADRAVLVPGDGRPLAMKALNAARAGASALLVYGTTLPAGGLDLDDSAGLPVYAIPSPVGRAMVAALVRGAAVSVTLSGEEALANLAFGTVPGFSSRGLAFDGRAKPDLVAAGVGIPTASAGRSAAGSPRYSAVTGSSAAAAVAAGAAALLAEAKPRYSASLLRSVLVGAATPLAAAATSGAVRGAGRIDVEAALAAPVAVEPATLALGRAGGRPWRARRTVTITNVSAGAVAVDLKLELEPGTRGIGFAARPTRLLLAPGSSSEVVVVARAPGGVDAPAAGALLVTVGRGSAVRVPWSVVPRAVLGPLVGEVRRTAAGPGAPERASVVSFRAGVVGSAKAGEMIEPVARLELELLSAAGERVGVLARERDLLPGRYAFRLTGRGPSGELLAPGRYRLRLVAHPVDGGRPTRVTTTFTVPRRPSR